MEFETVNCAVPANQPIYQALFDKAASYRADKPYQAKAYRKAAEAIAIYNLNLFEISEIYPDKIPGIGRHIEGFIYDFIDKKEAQEKEENAMRAKALKEEADLKVIEELKIL